MDYLLQFLDSLMISLTLVVGRLKKLEKFAESLDVSESQLYKALQETDNRYSTDSLNWAENIRKTHV